MAGTPYLVTIVRGGSEADATLGLGISLLVALVSLAPLGRLSGTFGLKRTLTMCMAWFAITLLYLGRDRPSLASSLPLWQGLIVFALAGGAAAALFVSPSFGGRGDRPRFRADRLPARGDLLWCPRFHRQTRRQPFAVVTTQVIGVSWVQSGVSLGSAVARADRRPLRRRRDPLFSSLPRDDRAHQEARLGGGGARAMR